MTRHLPPSFMLRFWLTLSIILFVNRLDFPISLINRAHSVAMRSKTNDEQIEFDFRIYAVAQSMHINIMQSKMNWHCVNRTHRIGYKFICLITLSGTHISLSRSCVKYRCVCVCMHSAQTHTLASCIEPLFFQSRNILMWLVCRYQLNFIWVWMPVDIKIGCVRRFWMGIFASLAFTMIIFNCIFHRSGKYFSDGVA